MKEESVSYKVGNDIFKGILVYDPKIKERQPVVLVAHAWKGLDDFAKSKAIELAGLGYVAFALDLYGNGVQVKNKEEAQALMLPLFIKRKLLRERICKAYEIIANHEKVDSQKIGAIGFCFGGLAVIELLRSGFDLKGVVSFHGVLGNSLQGNKAEIAPSVNPIKGSLLILHGHEDPLVSPQDIQAIQTEFTLAKVDWQMNIYGHAMHAFTNPEANEKGLAFNTKANQRSWQNMCAFFEEVFK
jgi:dienelactone hydrolase